MRKSQWSLVHAILSSSDPLLNSHCNLRGRHTFALPSSIYIVPRIIRESLDFDTMADDYDHTWQKMWKELYRQSLVEVISPQRPGALGYVVDKHNLVKRLTDASFGYRIHFGDLQRMHIQFLHNKLVNLTISAHLEETEWKTDGKAGQIGEVLKEYSKHRCVLWEPTFTQERSTHLNAL